MSILQEITSNKLQEIEVLKKSNKYSFEIAKLYSKSNNYLTDSEFQLIAEIKPKSPSAGIIRESFDPITLAKDFEQKGASAISVLTDTKYFGGSLELFKKVRQNTKLPLLRKDFILDEVQLFETCEIGANLTLIIVKILDQKKLEKLTQTSLELGLQPLIEFQNRSELEVVNKVLEKLDLENAKLKPILAVNNRNLETFETSIETCLNLANEIPKNFLKFALSGINEKADLEIIKDAGYNGVLIGQGIVTNPKLFSDFSSMSVKGIAAKVRSSQ